MSSKGKRGRDRRRRRRGTERRRQTPPAQQVPVSRKDRLTAIAGRALGVVARWIGHSWRVVAVVATIVGILASVVVFWPKVTIAPDAPLRAQDMLSTPFKVTNEEPLPIRDVRFLCQVDSFETTAGQEILNNRLAQRQVASALGPGQSVSGWCRTGNIIGTAGRQQIVRLTIEVSYRPFGLPLTRSVAAGFRTARGGDGLLHWTWVQPEAIWKPLWGG